MFQSLQSIDRQLGAITQHLPTSLNPLMQTVTHIGEPVVMALLLTGVILAGLTGRRPALAAFGAWGIAGLVFSNVLKLSFRRPRPDTYVPLFMHTYSFPSGHALGTMLTMSLLGYLAYKHFSTGWAFLAIALAAVFVILVGVSRVYLGAHYPSDVLGGWLIGALIAGLIIYFVRP